MAILRKLKFEAIYDAPTFDKLFLLGDYFVRKIRIQSR